MTKEIPLIVGKLKLEYKHSENLEREIRYLREGLRKIRDTAFSHNGDHWKAIECAKTASTYLEGR